MSSSVELDSKHQVAVFFYGTFMSSGVLKEQSIGCDRAVPAKLSGSRLSIRPRVNLYLQPEATA